MRRPLRVGLGGCVYHVLNRANGRLRLFHKDGDYEAFEHTLGESLEHVPGLRLLGYCVLPNHWHLSVWPRRDGQLSDFGHWLHPPTRNAGTRISTTLASATFTKAAASLSQSEAKLVGHLFVP